MCDRESRLKAIESAIGTFPDFPVKGIQFRDIFGVFRNPVLTQYLLDETYNIATCNIQCGKKIDAVVGLESRGFLLGPTLALRLNCSFVPARKAGKLPGPCYSHTYELEYGTDTLEIQRDSVKPGDNVLLFDDLIATGGTLEACVKLIRLAGATVLSSLTFMELKDLPGRKRLEDLGVSVHSIFQI
ncbi:unnamed protein product [Trichobilharzia szidati]|nr:unnamed protein product [Trichobilharzia szidati]CAH8872209.1 unnamed protein product [Trichobilharzia szidati]